MNYFYNLPDDLIDMIYKEVHKKKLNKINDDIKYIGIRKEQLFNKTFADCFDCPLNLYYQEYLKDPDKFLLMLSLECLFDLLEEVNSQYNLTTH
jgi:hypothetical protein